MCSFAYIFALCRYVYTSQLLVLNTNEKIIDFIGIGIISHIDAAVDLLLFWNKSINRSRKVEEKKGKQKECSIKKKLNIPHHAKNMRWMSLMSFRSRAKIIKELN